VRKFAVLVVLAILVASLGLGAWWWLRPSPSPRDSPRTVALPAIVEASATLRYLDGRGRPVADFVQGTLSLPSTASPSGCRDLIDDELSPYGSPGELGGLAQSIPDPVLRDTATAHLRSVADYVDSCGAGKPTTASATDAAWTGQLFERRLEDLRRGGEQS